MKAPSLRITNITDNDTEKHFNQCPSLRSRLSQGGYTIAAAELNKDIYDSATLSKSFARTPYFEIGIQLGTDNVIDAFPPIPPTGNAWKTPQHTNQLALVSTPTTIK